MGIFSEDMPAATSYGGGSGDPKSMGGVPAVMPSNDWWKNATDLAGRALDSYEKIQISRNQTGIAVPAGRVSSSPVNPAPGGAGLWFQNASTPGARAPGAQAGPRSMMSNQTLMIAGAVVLVVVLVLVRRHG